MWPSIRDTACRAARSAILRLALYSRTGGAIIFGIADEDERIVGLKKPNETIDLIFARRAHAETRTIEQHEILVIFRDGHVNTEQAVSPFNARQLLGLRMIQERGSITSREYVEAIGASERTAPRELREMVERGVIVVRGRTRSPRYFLP